MKNDSCSAVATILEELLELLNLEFIEENIFRGRSQDLGFGSVFGGQVLGQALSAATRTVSPERRVHSLHGYFMRPGIVSRPIVYQVECIRDGKSFNTRRVVAIQRGKAIFSMSASFQIKEKGFEHQEKMPQVPGPEGLMSELEYLKLEADRIPPSVRNLVLCNKPIEFRPVDPVDQLAPGTKEPVRYTWFKVNEKMPDDSAVNNYMLAYASDFGMMGTSLLPHGRTYWDTEMQVASLDHAMWFHQEFRLDDWLLYVIRSPRASRGLGLNSGSVFTRDGRLVASTAQEGLIRKLVKP